MLSAEELMLLNWGVGKDSPDSPWESLQGDPTGQSLRKSVLNIYLLETAVHGVARVRFDWATELNWTDAKAEIQYFEHLIWRIDSLKKTWYWERLKAGEGDDRGWDCWMAPLTLWTRVWASSGCWWWTEKPGMLQSMASQRVKQDWATKLNWADYNTQLFL